MADGGEVGASSAAEGPELFTVGIRNFVRPFTLASLKRLLSKGGASIADDGKEFWMDPIRTRCLVSYEDKAVAESVVATMSGKTWPTVGGKVLDAEMAVGSGFADVRRREEGAKNEVRCDGCIADTRRVVPQLSCAWP